MYSITHSNREASAHNPGVSGLTHDLRTFNHDWTRDAGILVIMVWVRSVVSGMNSLITGITIDLSTLPSRPVARRSISHMVDGRLSLVRSPSQSVQRPASLEKSKS